MKAQHIEAIAPGQAIRVGPGVDADMGFPTPEVGADWLGSAYITCNEPMGVIIDQLSNSPAGVVDPPNSENLGTLLSMRGMPYEDAWETMWYADLLYREISGWDSSIQVQNMTQFSMPTFVTVEFFDQSGDHIFYLGEWVCRNGTATFYLPAIIDLGVNFPFGYVGAAEIQSTQQIDYPGNWHAWGEPIFSVVDLKKTKVYDDTLPGWRHTVAGETQAGAYNAHPEYEKENAWGWAMPFIAKEGNGVTSRIAIRNNANCNKIWGKLFIWDETGIGPWDGNPVAVIDVPWLHPKHMKIVDLAYFGHIVPGFVGSATFQVLGVEDLCDVDSDGRIDKLPVMPSIVVLNYGFEKELPIGGGAGPQTTEGDLTRVYEAYPFDYRPRDCNLEICGQVIEELDLEPINNADVYTVVEGGNAPYTASGTAYVDVDCDDRPGQARLAGADVELQMLYDGWPYVPGWTVGVWYAVDDTTTSSAGWFQFKSALEWNEDGPEEYRVKIFVGTGGGNDVSYLSPSFFGIGNAVNDFTIESSQWGFDLDDFEWCPLEQAPDVEFTWQADTDSTGHYCFDYSKTAEPEDIILAADHGEHKMGWLTLEDVECDDQVANFELYPECDTISVDGWVYDKMTGEPIAGATVTAFNDRGFDTASTSASGYYFIELAFDPDNVTKVIAGVEGYTPHEESMYIPKCGHAYQTFQLHQTPETRVLLYWGNGGIPPAIESYTELQNLFTGMGYIVDYTSVWPTQFDWTLKYKLIVLLVPGYQSGDNLAVDEFTIGQKADLDRYLQGNGSLVIISDGDDLPTVENDLLTDLPVDMQFWTGAGSTFIDGFGDNIPGACATTSMAVYAAIDTLDNWRVAGSVGPAYTTGLVYQNGSGPGADLPMYAEDVPSHGNGVVRILGDMDGLSDAAYMGPFNWPGDNEWVPLNWIFCDP
jgi:hypothetical protein